MILWIIFIFVLIPTPKAVRAERLRGIECNRLLATDANPAGLG